MPFLSSLDRFYHSSTLRSVLERTTVKALPLVGRMTEATPVVAGCCNACRSCLTANVAALLAAVVAPLVRRFRRA